MTFFLRYDDVVRQFSSQRPFEDPNFPASNRVLVSDDRPTSIFTYSGYGGVSASSIQWLRPHVRKFKCSLNRNILLCAKLRVS